MIAGPADSAPGKQDGTAESAECPSPHIQLLVLLHGGEFHIELLRCTGLASIVSIEPVRYRDKPYVGVSTKPARTVQTLDIRLRFLERAWEMSRDHAITAEVERAMIWPQVRFVVGAVSVLIVASVTDRHNCAPSLRFSENDKKMIFRVAQSAEVSSESLLSASPLCGLDSRQQPFLRH